MKRSSIVITFKTGAVYVTYTLGLNYSLESIFDAPDLKSALCVSSGINSLRRVIVVSDQLFDNEDF